MLKQGLETTLTEYANDHSLYGPLKDLKESYIYQTYKILAQKGEVCLIEPNTKIREILEIDVDIKQARLIGESQWRTDYIKALQERRDELMREFMDIQAN